MKTVIALTFPRYRGFSAPSILAGFRRDFLDSWANKDVDGGFVSHDKGRSQPTEGDTKAS